MRRILSLLDPAEVATLKDGRTANQRLYKVLGWLETANQRGRIPSEVIDLAQTAAGYGGTSGANADKLAIIWSYQKLEKWGCFTPENLVKLKKGGSPSITQGEHAGNGIAFDHVLPRSIVPEQAGRLFNLEAIPATENLRKGAKITEWEIKLARRWARDGLLSAAGLEAIETAGE